MARNDTTSAIVDAILQVAVLGGVLSVTIIAPNAIQALDKPLQAYFRKMDKRAQEREIRRVMGYMRRQKLLAEHYEHGLQITEIGKRRLRRKREEELRITTPETWDGRWRLVLFDIPEEHNSGRRKFTAKLRELGFQQLQQSAWIHPFPCMDVIEVLAVNLDVSQFISCLEVGDIANERALFKRFSHILNTTSQQ